MVLADFLDLVSRRLYQSRSPATDMRSELRTISQN